MYKLINNEIIALTAQEIEELNARKEKAINNKVIEIAEKIRTERNELLDQSDWTQVADAPVDAEAWATYRQALRDLPTHTNFPHLTEADWPTKPE